MSWLSKIFGTRGFSPSCVARVLYQAAGWHYDQGKEVRFVVRNISPGQDHIQCQVMQDGDWQWSTQKGDLVYTGRQEYSEFETIKLLSLKQLFQERLDAEKEEL